MYVHTYCYIEAQCTGHCSASPTADHLKQFILMSVKILSKRIRSHDSILAQLTVVIWKSSRLLCEFLTSSCLNLTVVPEIFASVPNLVKRQIVQPTHVRIVTDCKYTVTKTWNSALYFSIYIGVLFDFSWVM